MNYFSTAQKHALKLKRHSRRLFNERIDTLNARMDAQQATFEEKRELYLLALSTRLLRAKFYSFPHYTNEELSYIVGCSSGTYLGLIMTRQKDPSPDLAKLMDDSLAELERLEGMQPIHQPPYPEK